MPKFTVNLHETVNYSIEVEAADADAAEERAVQMLLDNHHRDDWCTSVEDREIENVEAIKPEVTEAMEAEYVKHGGNKCLFCQAEGSLVGEGVEIEENTARQPVSCSECEFDWIDCYTLDRIIQ